MKRLLGIFSVVLLASVTSVGAQPQAPGPQPVLSGVGYGMAGCGLGSMLFGAKPGFVQVIAATTNGTSGSQTFGITSGTSNCKDPQSAMVSTAAFVQTNRVALAKDASRGQGETIVALTKLAGCADAGKVGVSLQRGYGNVFSSASVSDTQLSSNVISHLRHDSTLGCNKLN